MEVAPRYRNVLRMESRSKDLDVEPCTSEPLISRHEGSFEKRGKRDVRRVVRREPRTQTPDPLEQWNVRIPRDVELGQIAQCSLRVCCGELFAPNEPTQSVAYLDIQQMRCVEVGIVGDSGFHPRSVRCVQ